MGLFQRLFGGGSASTVLPALDLPLDPDSESGLTEEGGKALLAFALNRDFPALEAALHHPSAKVRAHAIGLVAIAGRIEPSAGGGVSFEIDVSGRPKGISNPAALSLLKKAAQDPDAAVRALAEEELRRSR